MNEVYTFAKYASKLSDNITDALLLAYKDLHGKTSNRQVANILEIIRDNVNTLRDAAIRDKI